MGDASSLGEVLADLEQARRDQEFLRAEIRRLSKQTAAAERRAAALSRARAALMAMEKALIDLIVECDDDDDIIRVHRADLVSIAARSAHVLANGPTVGRHETRDNLLS